MNGTNKRRFVLADPVKLEPVLKARLPLSINVYNTVKMSKEWTDDSKWYVLDGEISENSWIIFAIMRADYGQELSVSRPAEAVITPEIRDAFSSFMDWSENYIFSSIDTEVSAMVSEISIREKGNCTTIHPCYLYYMDIQDGLQLNTDFDLEEGVQVKDLRDELGKDFILSTWKYTTKRSDEYLGKCLSRNESSGVYVDGKPVSGVAFGTQGLISMLYTLKEQRGKGYAKFTMHSLMKKLAQNGLVPSCTVELRNEASKSFQAKIGFKIAAVVDYVVYEKAEF